MWVRMKASMFGLDKDVFVASVYLPPAGSSQLQPHSISSRFSSLREAVLMAQGLGYVILGGDFNAKVADMDDVLLPDRQFLEDSGLPCQRGCSHLVQNLHGQLLFDLCLSTSLLLGTGRLSGDAVASASFSRGGSGSRLDHFVMDRCTLARVTTSTVEAQRYDSDHKPLVLSLPLVAAAAAAAAGPVAPALPGRPLPNLRWDGSKKSQYAAQLRGQAPAIARCQGLVDAGQLDSAFQELGSVLVGAAVTAGCKSCPGSGRLRACKDKPYFDQECRLLRAKFRYALRHDPDSVRVLARRFSFVIRRKCRQHRQRQTPILLRHLRSNHKVFWQKLNARSSALPAALSAHSAWTSFHANLCSPPAVRLRPVPQPATGSQPGPPLEDLEGDISLAEVKKALPRLANGKATGQAGWPAELLRYAAYHVQLEDGSKFKVWLLAPLLTALLNACFTKGVLPAGISSALVTPVHKKGCTMDPSNYRPIAVGEPLYRLYTIILNARLVAWSELHNLRSPAQAGFRPRLSTIHHVFALRHFIDRALLQRRTLFVCFVDLQKAYDTVQHELLWARLHGIGVGPRMLAAVRSLYSSGTLSMKVGGTAGQPSVQQNGVRQGCPLSPTLFGIFFDGLHDHLHQHAPRAGLQLDSGRWVSSLVYADDVALLSWSSAGLQALLSCMHEYCNGLGLTISPTKTEVVVFNGCTSDTWHVGQHQLPQAASFKYLGFVFHESGSMSPAFGRLAQNGKGANARLHAKYKGLICDKSFPMMRRLFDAVVLPTVSYGCEVWAPACSGTLDPGLKNMLDIQIKFFRQLCHLRKSVTPAIIFREFAERPWLHIWWSQVMGFMRRLSNMPAGSLHLDILKDNITDAGRQSACGNWAKGIVAQFRELGLRSPFTSAGIGVLDSHGFMTRLAQQQHGVWAGLHVSPRTAPSSGAKLCTYHHWFGRPEKFRADPYYELPLPITRLRALMQFRMGSHCLPIEQGRFVRPRLPRHLRRCTLCDSLSTGDERHYLFECSELQSVRDQFSSLFDDASGSMRCLVWHKNQKAVSQLLTAVFRTVETLNTIPSS